MSYYPLLIFSLMASCVVSLRLLPGSNPKADWSKDIQDYDEDQSTTLLMDAKYEALRVNGYIHQSPATDEIFSTDTKGRTKKRIVTIGKYMAHGAIECPLSNCIVSSDVAQAPQADAIIYSPCFAAFPKNLLHSIRQDQKLIFSFFYESQLRFNKKASARTNLVDPYVNWTMTFHPESDFFFPMMEIVPKQPGDDVQTPGDDVQSYATGMPTRKRTNKILAIISNCQSNRMAYVRKLQKLLPTLSVYGRCGQKVPCAGSDESTACFKQFFQGFDFYMALENTRCNGYITEKVFRALENGMVPIVNGGFGRQDYDRIGIPRDAYLHVDDFSSSKDLAEHINNIDDSNYSKFHTWQEHSQPKGKGMLHKYCEVCDELVKPRDSQKPDRSFGKSVSSWFFAADKCHKNIGSMTSSD